MAIAVIKVPLVTKYKKMYEVMPLFMEKFAQYSVDIGCVVHIINGMNVTKQAT